jgi:hypothetical protein
LGFYTRGGREPYGALVPFLREFLDDALFDNAGNTKIDAENRSFIYDSEDKQVEVRDQANTIVGQYFYNGDGQRIKKVVPSTGETTIFVYDASNKLVAEYSTIVEPQATAKQAI